jgi:hypothetical protein
MNAPYLPPEQWVAVASLALIVASATVLLLLRRIDRIEWNPAVTS